MKLGKLLTVTVLATGVALGAFVDSAEAMRRRTKNTYSRRGTDENEVFSIYSLIDGINDTNTDNNVGFFPGAVEDYVFLGTLNNDPEQASFTTADLDINPTGLPSPIFYNPNGLPINFLGCSFPQPVIFFQYDSSNSNFPLVTSGKNVFFEFDNQGDISSLIDEQGNKSSVDCFEVEAVNPIQRADFQISRQGANIEYRVIAQDTNKILETFVIQNISLDVNNLSNFVDINNDNLRSNASNPNSSNSINVLESSTSTTTTVPESSTTNSILVVGVIGAGLLVKKSNIIS